MMNKKFPFISSGNYILALVCLIYLMVAFHFASDYGISWDQAWHEWYCAERNLRYLLTFDSAWLDFDRPVDFSMFGFHPDLIYYKSPWTTQNFGNMLSCIGCYVFFVKLHWLDSFTAHQAPNFFLIAAMLAAMFAFLRKNFGIAAAVIGTAAIAFQPQWFAHSFFNSKDIPYACMMAFTMLAGRRAILDRSAKWMLFAAILLGFTGGVKPNAFMVPLIFLLWYPFARLGAEKESNGCRQNNVPIGIKVFRIALLTTPLIALFSFIASWPLLWKEPDTIFRFLGYFFRQSRGFTPGSQWMTLLIFIGVQPPAVLLFGGIGIYLGIRGIVKNQKREIYVFLLLWFLVPVIRVLLPYTKNFDGVRHFIEYAVPLGALVGIGASNIISLVASKINSRWPNARRVGYMLGWAMIAPFLVAWLIVMFRIHPNEMVYYNFLVGGTKGMSEFCNCDDATDYWGNSYRQGIKWLNANAELGSTVVVPVGGHIVLSVQKMWMRRDLKLIVPGITTRELPDEFFKKIHPGTLTYIMYVTRKASFTDLIRELEQKGSPVFTIDVDGETILKILRCK